jgi:hypothetical protein
MMNDCYSPVSLQEARPFVPALAHAPRGGESQPAADARQADRGGSNGDLSLLVALAGDAEFFHAPGGEPYVLVPAEEHRETWALPSRGFYGWLSYRFYQVEGKVPSSAALREALRVFVGKAQHEGPTCPIFVRKAEHDGAIYLDLTNDGWQAVEITADGWRVSADPPVRFRRAKGMLPLPVPVRGGSIEELRPFVNAASEADFRLTVAWLLAALGPHHPYPVLAIHGEQGSAKTTRARVLRRLVDPHQAELRRDVHNARDLAIAAHNSHVVVLDNLRSLSPWLSDALCCLATGVAYTTRKLTTNEDEMIFEAMRPVILTSIGEVARASDLLDRSILSNLPMIPEEARQPEDEFWAAFAEARPRILGALLDAMVVGLRRLPETRPERLPRMADFARWGTAVEPALGWEPGSFLAAYRENRREANSLALEAVPLAGPVRQLVESVGEWKGICKDLLPLLAERAGEDAAGRRGWPGTPEALSLALRGIAPNLRAEGVAVEFLPRTKSGRPLRLSKCGGAGDRLPSVG